MNYPHESTSTSPTVPDEPVLGDDELKTLAKFLDALMEVDFEQQYNSGIDTDSFYSQSVRTSI